MRSTASRAIRAVDATGAVLATEDGSQEQQINDTYLRSEFPAAGAVKRPRSPQTTGRASRRPSPISAGP